MSHTTTESEGAGARCLLLADGAWVEGEGDAATLLDKYTLEPITEVRAASDAQLDRMISVAERTFRGGAPSAYERGEILARAAALVAERAAELIETIVAESGFTAADAKGEVTRCTQTFRLSAEEARRLAGEMVPMEGAPNQARRLAFTLRVPLGVVLAITPFNSPLNTVTHKIAPAFAAGNAVILKPASATPMTACKLAEILLEAGVPPGFLSVLHGSGPVAQKAIADPRIRFIAFTGSTEVGRKIQAAAGLRRTQMELGSISFVILNKDADLDTALPKVVGASFRKAGQVCTSVQILLAHTAIRNEVSARMTELVSAVPFGDPKADGTVTGPLISEQEAIRVERWIDDALAKCATRLVGGARERAVLPPTLLAGITSDMNVACSEIFGPVLCIDGFDTKEEAIARVNATPYGLATGVFTNDLKLAFEYARRLEVGGVHVNETSSSRVDLMPYGGSKDSGFGREGPHYAVQEMTEERIVSITL